MTIQKDGASAKVVILSGVEHGRSATYARGCRCGDCREARRIYQQELRKRKRQDFADGKVKITHGDGGYVNYGCRCEVCTTAHSRRNAETVKRYQDRNPGPARSQWHEGNVSRVRELNRGYRINDQAETVERAKRSGHLWTGAELELAGRKDLTAKQVALMLGRTLHAVNTVRRQLKGDPKTIKTAGLPQGPPDPA